MRIVYDDTMQKTLVLAVDNFMSRFDPRSITEYDYGMNRVQIYKLRDQLRSHLQANYRLEIGKTVTHANGLGNNCCYPVYYHPENSSEIQQCASININTGMFGEGFVSCEDYNGRRVGPAFEVHPCCIKRNN